MPLGSFVRSLLGPFERPVSEAYRGLFVDLSALARQIRKWAPAEEILEVGCGEGALTERLAGAYPEARLTGIDITPKVGRMFAGDESRVTFKVQTIGDFAATSPRSVDLLVISDVLHHVPWEMHKSFLEESRQAIRPGGFMVFKDWARTSTPIHYLCHFTDVFITGDRVRHRTVPQHRELILEVFGDGSIIDEMWIRPWTNNATFLVRVAAT